MNYDNYELDNGKTIYPLFEFQKDNKKYIGFVDNIPYTKEDITVAIENDNTLIPVDSIAEIKPIIDKLISTIIDSRQ